MVYKYLIYNNTEIPTSVNEASIKVWRPLMGELMEDFKRKLALRSKKPFSFFLKAIDESYKTNPDRSVTFKSGIHYTVEEIDELIGIDDVVKIKVHILKKNSHNLNIKKYLLDIKKEKKNGL